MPSKNVVGEDTDSGLRGPALGGSLDTGFDSALARRRSAARLLLLASYRPAEVSAGQHPLKRLKQDLVTHKLGTEVALRPLEKDAVREYLVQQFNRRRSPRGCPALCTSILRAIRCS